MSPSLYRYSDIANVFNDSFEEIAPRYAKLKELSLSDVIELIDETQNILDDVWKAEVRSDQRYPQARMVKLPLRVFSSLCFFPSCFPLKLAIDPTPLHYLAGESLHHTGQSLQPLHPIFPFEGQYPMR